VHDLFGSDSSDGDSSDGVDGTRLGPCDEVGAAAAARVRSVNLADGRTARQHVVAVDQCPRCRPSRGGEDTSWRTFERLGGAPPATADASTTAAVPAER
jgi:hypothetical protein